ncbi:MAG: hypothetical protein AMXMBFR57_23990 [Acidimicrobiia bacterium]
MTTLRGKGRIFRDGALALDGARYVVHIITRAVEPDQPGHAPATGLEGVLMSDAPFELLRQPIELELEDGRRWHCYLQSTSGDLVDRDGLR